MIRGGKNYKKKKQFPDWDANKLESIMRDAVSTPPEKVKQPFDTNQPYQTVKFGAAEKPEFNKKSG